MKHLLTAVIALLAVTLLLLPEAEARRMGGGTSIGKQYQAPSSARRDASQPAGTAAQRPQGQAAPQSGIGRWLGPLAGLAAGGLLAAMFFGGAFEGVSAMDVILIIALVAGAFLLFRALRRRAPVPAAAGHGHAFPGTGQAPFPASGTTYSTERTAEVVDQAPAWLDRATFAAGAKSHFVRLQAAWDQSDFRDIQEYTTPALYAELHQKRDQLGAGQVTEVVTLNAELLGTQRDGDLVVASVLFSGLIREEVGGPANPFREVWHVQHDWHRPQGDWRIAGIEQMDEGA